jgi:hypothetical protein
MWTANCGRNSVTKISPAGITATYTGTGGCPYGIAFDGTNMWTTNNGDDSVTKISPTGTMTTYTGVVSDARGIAFDGTNMWTANGAGQGTTEISPTGTMTTYYLGAAIGGLAFDGTNMWMLNDNDAGNGAMKFGPVAGTLVLRGSNAAQDPTFISAVSGTVYLWQGTGGAIQALTSNKVVVKNLSFTRHFSANGSSAYGADSVSYSFTMAANTANATKINSQTFQNSAVVRAPVPQIARLQQAKAESASASSLSAAYPTANTSGNLLIAIVSNTGSSSAVFGISDTAGNAWTTAANPKYPAYNQEATVFYAANAKSGVNTVTVSSTATVANLSLFIYEYRGATTTVAAQVGAQLQANNASPSSGSITPTTAGVGLVMGLLYSNPSGVEIPNAGSGFAVITTSSLSATYVEDMNAYVTSPLSATWQYPTQSPSSSAAIILFK